MSDNVPETGDVVIHKSESGEMPSFAISAVPGPDQFGCATRGEAERMARSCAKRSGVNLWFSEDPTGSPCWLASAARRVESLGERARPMTRLARSPIGSYRQPEEHVEQTHSH